MRRACVRIAGDEPGTLLVACSSSSAIGSGRLVVGSHEPWLLLGVSLRAPLPLATRSSGLRWVTFPAVPGSRAPDVVADWLSLLTVSPSGAS